MSNDIVRSCLAKDREVDESRTRRHTAASQGTNGQNMMCTWFRTPTSPALLAQLEIMSALRQLDTSHNTA